MKVFLVIHLFGLVSGTVGPLGDQAFTEKEDIDQMMTICQDYIKKDLDPEMDAIWSNPEKVAKAKQVFPNMTKDSLYYTCEAHENRPPNDSNEELNRRGGKK